MEMGCDAFAVGCSIVQSEPCAMVNRPAYMGVVGIVINLSAGGVFDNRTTVDGRIPEYQQTTVSHGFKVVQDFVHPQHDHAPRSEFIHGALVRCAAVFSPAKAVPTMAAVKYYLVSTDACRMRTAFFLSVDFQVSPSFTSSLGASVVSGPFLGRAQRAIKRNTDPPHMLTHARSWMSRVSSRARGSGPELARERRALASFELCY